jgi:hypothetical protein
LDRGSLVMPPPTSAAGGSSLPSVIALSLACIGEGITCDSMVRHPPWADQAATPPHGPCAVLFQSPVFTIVSSGRDVSPLEVAAIAALQLSPDLRPAVRAVLLPGAAWREV